MPTALISVSDKTGLTEFLTELNKFQTYKLVATGSTAQYLKNHGFTCQKVEELTKFPEILSGRVKTLHPKVLAGILARPSVEDRSCLAEMDIQEIDLVIVNLYPFEEKLKQSLSESEMIEEIDIGGVTLLRAAAKNFIRVAIVSSINQYSMVIDSLKANSGKFSETLKKQLALASFERTAQYDTHIASYLRNQESNSLDIQITLNLSKQFDLRFGENPHQSSAWYQNTDEKSASFPPFEQLQGKELSANNITDVYALVNILRDINGNSRSGKESVCIIKHNNPCGIAQDKNMSTAFKIAYACDPISAFGGIYGFTSELNEELANKIIENFVEIVLAPAFSTQALSIFSKKKNLRVLKIKPDFLIAKDNRQLHFKDLADFGFLVEKQNEAWVDVNKFQCVTKSQLSNEAKDDVSFAWSVVKNLTSNAIFVTSKCISLGFGIGQTNRVGSVKLALQQAGDKANGAILASDGFFPLPDSIEEAKQAGIKIILQPGGSIKDKEVIEACDKAGITMLFTGQRCFKH
jgi:phosphoribosylaminoimidazolecarboxamide formyltransferase/IMP cyclohydrolase